MKDKLTLLPETVDSKVTTTVRITAVIEAPVVDILRESSSDHDPKPSAISSMQNQTLTLARDFLGAICTHSKATIPFKTLS